MLLNEERAIVKRYKRISDFKKNKNGFYGGYEWSDECVSIREFIEELDTSSSLGEIEKGLTLLEETLVRGQNKIENVENDYRFTKEEKDTFRIEVKNEISETKDYILKLEELLKLKQTSEKRIEILTHIEEIYSGILLFMLEKHKYNDKFINDTVSRLSLENKEFSFKFEGNEVIIKNHMYDIKRGFRIPNSLNEMNEYSVNSHPETDFSNENEIMNELSLALVKYGKDIQNLQKVEELNPGTNELKEHILDVSIKITKEIQDKLNRYLEKIKEKRAEVEFSHVKCVGRRLVSDITYFMLDKYKYNEEYIEKYMNAIKSKHSDFHIVLKDEVCLIEHKMSDFKREISI